VDWERAKAEAWSIYYQSGLPVKFRGWSISMFGQALLPLDVIRPTVMMESERNSTQLNEHQRTQVKHLNVRIYITRPYVKTTFHIFHTPIYRNSGQVDREIVFDILVRSEPVSACFERSSFSSTLSQYVNNCHSFAGELKFLPFIFDLERGWDIVECTCYQTEFGR